MKCFHHNDMDGYSAAAIVARETNNYNKEDYIEIDYVTPLPIDIVEEGETVYFVDYSFSRPNIKFLKELLERGCSVIWIDHHITSINTIEEYPEYKSIPGMIKIGESGALLTYKYFHPDIKEEHIPNAIKLVSDYDCWQFKYEDNTTFFKLGVDASESGPLSQTWIDAIYEKRVSKVDELINAGSLIKKYVDEENKYYREHYGYASELGGRKCFALNLKTNSWVFGEKYEEGQLCVAYTFNGDRYVYTLYSSNPDIDCAKIAKEYGGGGHAGAAGFSSNILLVTKV